MGLNAAAELETIVNGYVDRALLSREHLDEISEGFGGMELPPWPMDSEARRIIAHAVGDKVLGPTWHIDVVEEGTAELPKVRIVIVGRTPADADEATS